jgi:hypothetical protein
LEDVGIKRLGFKAKELSLDSMGRQGFDSNGELDYHAGSSSAMAFV